MSFEVSLSGNKAFVDLMGRLPAIAGKAATLAVNAAARFSYAEASRGIRKQLNVPQAYIGSAQAGNRLRVSRWAQDGNATATISASARATSLARYATDKSIGRRKRGVSVRVKPGSMRNIKSGFLLRLKAGASLTEDQYNLGLAVRLKPGGAVHNKKFMKPYGKKDPNLYLLYAPSVYQVFRGVAADIEPAVSSFVAKEFLRQFERLSRGG